MSINHIDIIRPIFIILTLKKIKKIINKKIDTMRKIEIPELKELLKQKASEILKLKIQVNEYQAALNAPGLDHTTRIRIEQENSSSAKKLNSLKKDYREHHIAYCELRGLSRSQIEPPISVKPADEKKISTIKEKYKIV
jgi:hypothetical protein